MDQTLAQRLRLLDANLEWFGHSILDAMEKAGRGVAKEVQKALSRKSIGKAKGKKGPTSAKIAVFCGPGNKSGDGFVAARYLTQFGHAVSVFLVAEPKTKESYQNLKRLEKLGKGKIKIRKIDVASLPKEKFDVFVDALLGTGLVGPLRPPYDTIVNWLNQQTGLKVAIDLPTGLGGPVYFQDNITVSMHVSKKKGAKVVDVGIPRGLEHQVGPAHVKTLRLNAEAVKRLKLNQDQHKGQNGVLTIVGGSRKYHGAPLYAIEAATPFVDLIYFHSPEKDNRWIARQMKPKSKAFITVESRKDVDAAVEKSDVVLIGNGLEENAANKRLVNRLLGQFPKKKFVLDAGGMMLADSKLFSGRVILTPHSGEFKRRFSLQASTANAKKTAEKHDCIILLKGPTDVITDGKNVFWNATGNSGMTRGGTGDVLAGLVAALATQNDLFLAAQAGAFLNGLAGDLVAKKKQVFAADDVTRALSDALEKAFKT